MNGQLNGVSFATWSAIDIPGISQWLWMDTSGGGLHLQAALGDPPADVTHLWGWDADGKRLARLRIDRDLGDGDQPGVRGAVLDLAGNGDGQSIEVETWDGQIWHPSDGRINADQQHPVFTGARLTTLFTVYRDCVDVDGRITQAPLTFVHIDDMTAQ